MIFPEVIQTREKNRPLAGLKIFVICGIVRDDLYVRILLQHLEDKCRRCGNSGILNGRCYMHQTAGGILPFVNRGINQFSGIVEDTFTDDMF
jgi:hypothetical protein